MHGGHDIRTDIFKTIADRRVTAQILADASGVIAGIDEARAMAADIGILVLDAISTGSRLGSGDQIMKIQGTPMQIAMGEDRLIGCLAKPSGIATMARRFVDQAADDLIIVSGAWKKMPIELKPLIRNAAAAGGAEVRISRTPFIYLDKNYVRMFAGIENTLHSVSGLNGYRRVIQVCGQFETVEGEAVLAAGLGADVIFIDTGNPDDISKVSQSLRDESYRSKVEVAFGSGVTLDMIEQLRHLDVDLVDVGRPIIDAPLLDMHLTVRDVTEIA
ncbi:MAG: quinolinate phosphoribosyl transferase [Rhodospirillaceae bacterium]|nr:MAG: quinolinate phosphoribosyl transferase [Rhodospirillaceae bacterium]